MGESACIRKGNDRSGKIVTVSSLDKVFPKEGPNLLQTKYTIFKNETFHFQVCFGRKKATCMPLNQKCLLTLSSFALNWK